MTQDTLTQRHSYRMRDGVEIVADVGGPEDAPVVVFMHGGGQTRHSWSGALPALIRAGYRVINYDARGHGNSGWSPDGIYSSSLGAGDLATILQDVKTPVAQVGASMGGITALQAVGEGLEPVASALVMVDIVPRPNPAGVDHIQTFMRAHGNGFANIEEAVDAVAAYNPHRPRPRNPAGLMKNLRLRDDGRLYWHWDPRMLDNVPPPEPGGFVGVMIENTRKIRVPTLLVRGLSSDIVTDEAVQEFRDLCPTLEVFDVAGAGHMVVGDSNSVFNQGIVGFLQRHMPA